MERKINVDPEQRLSNAGISVQGIFVDADPGLVFIKNPDRPKKEETTINLSGGRIYPA